MWIFHLPDRGKPFSITGAWWGWGGFIFAEKPVSITVKFIEMMFWPIELFFRYFTVAVFVQSFNESFTPSLTGLARSPVPVIINLNPVSCGPVNIYGRSGCPGFHISAPDTSYIIIYTDFVPLRSQAVGPLRGIPGFGIAADRTRAVGVHLFPLPFPCRESLAKAHIIPEPVLDMGGSGPGPRFLLSHLENGIDC